MWGQDSLVHPHYWTNVSPVLKLQNVPRILKFKNCKLGPKVFLLQAKSAFDFVLCLVSWNDEDGLVTVLDIFIVAVLPLQFKEFRICKEEAFCGQTRKFASWVFHSFTLLWYWNCKWRGLTLQ